MHIQCYGQARTRVGCLVGWFVAVAWPSQRWPQRSAVVEPEMRPYKAARTRPLPSPLVDRDKSLLHHDAQPVGPVHQVGSSGFPLSGAPKHRLSHHPSLMPRNHRPTAPRRGGKLVP